MIPDSAWWALPKQPGPHRVLLLLWAFSRWREGCDEPPFAWPSIEKLAERLRLRPRAIRDAIEKLDALGYVRAAVEVRYANGRRDERVGWRLFESPDDAQAYDRARALESQLDLFADDPSGDAVTEPEAPTEGFPCAQPVDDGAGAQPDRAQVRTESAQVRTEPCAGAHEIGAGAHDIKEESFSDLQLSVVERQAPAPANDDDDAARIWSAYEADRARMLGGTPRGGAPPPALRALIAEIGLARVESYTRRALDLAAEAVARDRQCAATLVLARSDGHEWHLRRVEAVERYPDPPRAPILVPRAMPPPDPLVDGQRVTLHEREAYERGGDEGVRAQRRELAERPLAGVAVIDRWLAKHRVGGDPCGG